MAREQLPQIVSSLGEEVQSDIDSPKTIRDFKELVASSRLRALLMDALEVPAGAATLAKSSHIHSNSFVKIPLIVAPSGAKLGCVSYMRVQVMQAWSTAAAR